MLMVLICTALQHLLGILQIVDRDLAFVRSEKAPASLLRLLKSQGITVVPVAESIEVRMKMGFNFVTVKPRSIVMSAGCPDLKKIFKDSGIKIVAEADVSQMCNAAGGIGCVTGVLGRKVLR